MEKIFYTGIGSRKTPTWICSLFKDFAYKAAKEGLILRSGGAAGADLAFEQGCIAFASDNNLKDIPMTIMLPCKDFNGLRRQSQSSDIYTLTDKAVDSVKIYHPAPYKLSFFAQKLMARNYMQVLGEKEPTPSKFVLCWTPESGGTQQALRIAKDHSIKIYNLFNVPAENICDLLNNLLK